MSLPKISFNPGNILPTALGRMQSALHLASFLFLIFVVCFQAVWSFLKKVRFLAWLTLIDQAFNRLIGTRLAKLVNRLDCSASGSVRKTYLIKLSLQNIRTKKVRSIVTIGGMALGIGAIVLLVSFGYGLEKLVISKVARLNELKMIDVGLGSTTNLALNSDVVSKVKELEGIDDVLPIVSVVGKVSINDSISDVIAYAVSEKYLQINELKAIRGNLLSKIHEGKADVGGGSVAGEAEALPQVDKGKRATTARYEFNIVPQQTVIVWEDCSISSKVAGYTVRTEGGFIGSKYWGSSYYSPSGFGYSAVDKSNHTTLGLWMKATVPLFQKDAESKLLPDLNNNGSQVWYDGCVGFDYLKIENELVLPEDKVLGESTASATLTDARLATSSAVLLGTASYSTDSARISNLLSSLPSSTGSSDLLWTDLDATESARTPEIMVIDFKRDPVSEAFVSTGMLRLLGLSEDEAVGRKFKISFVLIKSLVPDIEGKAVSTEQEYEIVGVFEDESSYFYIHFQDLSSLGVSNYSQLKVITKAEDIVSSVRRDIETMGFATTSTTDTVSEIEKIFSTIRLLLASLGLVALGVAALGMFNTLTVSLLERTREVGVMKAIGMKSEEVKQLFLSEAMVIGTAGGLFGLIFGWLTGKLISILISVVSIINHQGLINITYTPVFFAVFIFIFSFVVGVVTGIYPARRATRISALDALRYE